MTEVLSTSGLPWVGTDRELSILDSEALDVFAIKNKITWIINCAAYTAVDKAEEERELAYQINAVGPENLAIVAKHVGARLIHISTDYVFPGDGTRPYLESDAPAPIGYYGETKAIGEAKLLAANPDSFIVRTSWLYGKHGQNFVYTMLRLMKEKETLNVVADQKGTPTWTWELSHALLDFIEQDSHAYGIYHYSGDGETTWFGFAREIYELSRTAGLLRKECVVTPVTTEQYPTKTKRPNYSVLSKAKIKRTLSLEIPEWQESLKKFITIESEKKI